MEKPLSFDTKALVTRMSDLITYIIMCYSPQAEAHTPYTG